MGILILAMFVMVMMSMVVVIFVIVMMMLIIMPVHILQPVAFAAPGTPEHPERGANNDHWQFNGSQGSVDLSSKALADHHPAKGNQPDHRGMRNGCCQSEHHRLFNGAFDGDERRHPQSL